MTILSTRDALAKGLHGLDSSACPHGWEKCGSDGQAYWRRKADDLIASGAVIDAATLADDEALVMAGWDASTASVDTVAAIYRALAAALTERSAQ
jgi:hypothetical protein